MQKSRKNSAASRIIGKERRLSHGGGHTGWSRAWIINHYAKLWDKEAAYYKVSIPSIQQMSASAPPFTQSPLTKPLFHAAGSAGRSTILSKVLCTSGHQRRAGWEG